MDFQVVYHAISLSFDYTNFNLSDYYRIVLLLLSSPLRLECNETYFKSQYESWATKVVPAAYLATYTRKSCDELTKVRPIPGIFARRFGKPRYISTY